MGGIRVMWYPVDSVKHTSAGIVSIVQCPTGIWESCNSGCGTLHCILFNNPTIWEIILGHRRAVQYCDNLRPYTAAFILSTSIIMAATNSILTWHYEYSHEDFPLLSLSSSSPIWHKQIMDTQPPQLPISGSKSRQLVGITSDKESLARRRNADTRSSMDPLPMQPPDTWPKMHIYKLSVIEEQTQIWTSMQLDISIFISV
jgi:hypothetical protein